MTQQSNISISVRLAESRDASIIADFTRTMAWETEEIRLEPGVVLKGVQAVFENPNLGFYVVALHAEQIIGCLMITYEWSDWRNGVQWWLQSVYIESDYRRMGVFQKLYEFVMQLVSDESNVCGVRLYVENQNAPAMATYEKLGMKRTEYLVYETSLQSQ